MKITRKDVYLVAPIVVLVIAVAISWIVDYNRGSRKLGNFSDPQNVPKMKQLVEEIKQARHGQAAVIGGLEDKIISNDGQYVNHSGFGDTEMTFHPDHTGTGGGFCFSQGVEFTWRIVDNQLIIENWKGYNPVLSTSITSDGRYLTINMRGSYLNLIKAKS